METYQQISSAAKEKVKSSPKEAFDLYKRLWEEFPDEFNDWDGMFMMQAAKLANYRIYGDLIPVVEKFKEEEKVVGNYGWYIFDLFVKQKDATQLRGNEKPILSLAKYGIQKDMSIPQDYPCPLTISVFKLLDAFSEQASFNAAKVRSCLELINPAFLSDAEESFKTQEGREVVKASFKEKYYSRYSKALDRLEDFDNCIRLSQEGLTNIEKFHNDNDLWFQYRIAKSQSGLGNTDIANNLFQELVETRVGATKWFLFKEIAKIYFDEGDYATAQKYSIKGLLLGEEIKLSKELYILQAQIFFKLKEIEHVEVIARLLNSFYVEEENSRVSVESKKLIDYCSLSPENAKPLKEERAIANDLFIDIRFKGQSKQKGKIVSVHRNGKSGLIVGDSENKFGFRKQNFRKKQRDLQRLKGAEVSFFESKDYSGKAIADIILVDNMPKSNGASSGKKMIGKINGISELGIFVDFKSGEKGLVHKSKLSNNFLSKYSKGDLLNVKVIKKTDKGLDLSLDE